MIPWGTLASMSPAVMGWTLLGIAVAMLMTGRLVPRFVYLEQKKATENYRLAFEAERDKNTRLLVPLAELNRDVLRSIPKLEFLQHRQNDQNNLMNPPGTPHSADEGPH